MTSNSVVSSWESDGVIVANGGATVDEIHSKSPFRLDITVLEAINLPAENTNGIWVSSKPLKYYVKVLLGSRDVPPG